MNTKNNKKSMMWVIALVLAFTSCVNDLNTIPLDEDLTTGATVYDNPEAYRQVLAKCYAGLATTGQQGAAGDPDVKGIDEGFSSYLRNYWYLQELTTEEAIVGWGDDGLPELHSHIWTSNNNFVVGFYYRVFFQIAIANELIRESAEAKLNERGVTEAQKAEIGMYRAEARFLRALSYWHALDLYGVVPFVTEKDGVGTYLPKPISKADLFNYVESELKELETLMAEPRANEYGRADRASAWMVLAKLYLNAEVYIGTPKYTEAATYAKKIIDAGYTLDPSYKNLFLADNHTADGIIFAIPFDGVNTKTWGGTTFIIDGAIGGTMVPAEFGVKENWSGFRTTSSFVKKFPQYADAKSVVVTNKSANAYPILHCPGSYQGWKADDNTTVVYSRSSDNLYEGYLYFKDANTEFKFDVKGDWSENYGDDGANGSLEPNGANIKVADAGLYKVNVDMNLKTFTITKTEWGIIGSATAGGWDNDYNMTLNSDGTLSAEIKFSAGEWKFRANDAWAIDLSDADGDGILTPGGGNIKVATPGKYIVTLILNVADYTYTMVKASSDERAMFHTDGQKLEIDEVSNFTHGYAITKWRNVTSTGVAGSDPVHTDTDFPMFRLSDAYLIYAEAALRGNGDKALALEYVNKVRTRAYTDNSGNITANELTLDFILDERARELYWEGHRRTDLIRYGIFTGDSYIWPWKGGVKDGKTIDAKYKLFPIPASDLIANPNLEPTPGY